MLRWLAMTSAALICGCAPYDTPAPTPVAPGGETIIPFAANGGIVDWHAENDRSIFLRDRAGHWYFVTLASACPGLQFNQNILFSTDPSGNFDRFSAISTRDYRCAVQSIVRSGAPAAKGRG